MAKLKKKLLRKLDTLTSGGVRLFTGPESKVIRSSAAQARKRKKK